MQCVRQRTRNTFISSNIPILLSQIPPVVVGANIFIKSYATLRERNARQSYIVMHSNREKRRSAIQTTNTIRDDEQLGSNLGTNCKIQSMYPHDRPYWFNARQTQTKYVSVIFIVDVSPLECILNEDNLSRPQTIYEVSTYNFDRDRYMAWDYRHYGEKLKIVLKGDDGRCNFKFTVYERGG